MKICDRCSSDNDIQAVDLVTSVNVMSNQYMSRKIDLCQKCIDELIDLNKKWIDNKLKLCRCKHKEIEFREVTE